MKHLFSAFLAIAILFSTLVPTIQATDSVDETIGISTSSEVDSIEGICGDNLTWTLTENGTLSVSGTGPMYDYYYFAQDAPWYNYIGSINEIIITEGVTSIGDNAFYGSESLTNVVISESVTSIGDNAFYGSESLTNVVISESVTHIGILAFCNCSSLINLTLPESMTYIGSYVFSGCSALENITLPDSITVIENGAFNACNSLCDIYYCGTVEQWNAISIDENNDCLIFNATVHFEDVQSSVTWSFDETTGTLTFSGTGTMENYNSGEAPWHQYSNDTVSVIIEYGITAIGRNAFSEYYSLTDVAIPDSVSVIRNQAFYFCEALTNITIPDSVKYIGSYVFSCSSLTNVTIPNKVKSIGNCAFYRCSYLEGIYVDANNPYYSNDSCGILFDKDKTMLIAAPGAISGEYIIPTSVTSIGAYALARCGELTSIMIPSSVTEIWDNAFMGCTLLADVYYIGTEEQWNNITISYNNDSLINAIIHYHEHDYNEVVVTAPTCTNQGYTTYICSCGSSYISDYTDVIDHSYVVIETKASTCTEIGHATYACDCGCSYSISLDLVDHEFSDDVCAICGKARLGEMSFSDISSDIEYYDVIKECYDAGIIGGYDDGNFHPDEYITRGDLVNILYHIAILRGESMTSVANPYSDIIETDWCYKAAIWASNAGIVSGYSSGGSLEFRHETAVTNYELAVIIARYFKDYLGVEIPDSNLSSQEFSDVSSSHWAKDYTEYVRTKGLMLGDEENRFNGNSYTTRAEFSAILSRILPYLSLITATVSPTTMHWHIFDVTVTEEPTCEENGEKLYVCCCGFSKTEVLGALNHEYVYHPEKYPTCTEIGWATYDTCTRCDYTTYVEIPATGHTAGIEVIENSVEPTCTVDGSYDTVTYCTVCGTELSRLTTIVSALGHTEVIDSGVDATCTESGLSEGKHCSVCGDILVAQQTIPTLGHDKITHAAKAASCTEIGWDAYEECSRCNYTTYVEIPATGHTYGEWVVDVAASVLAKGSQHRVCTACEHTETQTIDCIEIDIDTNSNYGLAMFTVVNAQTLEPINGAQIFISTENDGENTFVTDSEGRVSIVLPIGKQVVSVFASGCLTRNLNVNIKAGVNEINKIGLSNIPTYNAEITSTLMTIEEIEEAGIDTSDPSNQQVYKYELKLEFAPEVDASSIVAYFNADGTYIGGYSPDNDPIYEEEGGEEGEASEPTYNLHYHVTSYGFCGSWCKNVEVNEGQNVSLTYQPSRNNEDYIFDGWYEDKNFINKIQSVNIEDYTTYVYGRWIYIGEETTEPITATSGIRVPVGDEVITVYPVNEYFYLIIRGEVKWLKEMFDVEMLVINNSMTDTLEDLTATLELPEGLSLAKMLDEQQVLTQEIDYIGEGESKSVHWYVRGDTAGSYSLKARLEGMVMPFEEPIDDLFVAENQIQVWGGDALSLHFEFPNAAYYGEDYPITITLTNVSDITLYNINHMVQIEQGMIVYYSDGTQKEKIERSSWESIGVREFHPGDKIIVETSVNIFFESKIIQMELEKLIGIVDGIEQLVNAFKAVQTVIDATDGLINCVSDCSEALDDFNFSSNGDNEKLKLFEQLYSRISGLASSYTTSGNKTIDAAVGLANSGVNATLNAITSDPDEWLNNHSVDDIEDLLSKIGTLENSIVSSADTSKKFDIYDSIRTAISAIPIRFALKNVIMTEDENNTTSIPWSFSVTDASVQYFGVSNVSKYLMSLTQAALGEVYDEAMPWYLQLIPGLDDPFNKDSAIKYIQATENEVAQFKAKDATGKVTFKVWVERKEASTYSLERNATTSDFILSCDNETATYENGILTFTGDGMISVTPQSQTGATLYIEDSEGNIYTYVIDVVEEHTCSAGEQQVIIAPTADYDGFAVKCCSTCGDIMEIIPLYYENCCNEHNFSDWTTTLEPTCTNVGLQIRSCNSCGLTQYQFLENNNHEYNTAVEIIAPTCTEDGYTVYACCCGDTCVGNVVPALGHDTVQHSAKDATCTEIGWNAYETCTRCDYTTYVEIPTTGHSYSSVVTAPTCTEQGYTTYTCHCGDSYVSDYVDANGHTEDAAVTENSVSATCTVDGSYDTVTYCTVCGTELSRVTTTVPATGHEYSSVVTAPTCTDQGYTMYTCHCGDSYIDDYVDATGHSFDEWVITLAPTCTTVGTERRDCDNCDHHETREAAALGHDFAEDFTVDVEATTEAPGQQSRHCTRCDEVTDVTEIPKLATVIDTSSVYKDVKPKSWFKSAVDYVVNNGLMNGMTADTFEPNTPMSRAMLVTVLWRLEGFPAPKGATPFTDLKQVWYKDAVAWAYENSIVNGTSADKFSPNDNITREQMAAILYRYSEYKGEDTTARADISAYPDANQVSKYARDAFAWANAEGLITGTTENGSTILAPRASATRAQVATILMRFCEK